VAKVYIGSLVPAPAHGLTAQPWPPKNQSLCVARSSGTTLGRYPEGKPASVCALDLSLLRDDRVSLTVVGADGCNGAGAVRTLTAASLAGLRDGCGRSVVGRRLVAVVVSTALVSACAGGSKSAAPTAGNKVDRSRAAVLETAVRAYSTVVLDGESAKAYTLLSKRCRERMTEAAFEKIATGGAALYGTARLKTLRSPSSPET